MSTPSDAELAALSEIFDLFTRRYKLGEALGAEKPLNELDKQVLVYVGRHPECGPTDVSRFLGVPTTTISSSSDRLAKRDLIERHRPEHDRRAVSLRLTPTGQSRVDALQASYSDLHRRMLEPLTITERRQLIAMMTKILSSDP
jgi:DNA-binding MarR family transcriptional regulator